MTGIAVQHHHGGHVGIEAPALLAPPAANGRERGRVVIGPDIHEPGVPLQIVDPIRVRSRHGRRRKVVAVDARGRLRPTPLPPGIGKVANEFLLLRVLCFGKSPWRSSRQIVERDKPVLSLTTGNLKSLRGSVRPAEDACAAVAAVAGRGTNAEPSPTRSSERTRTLLLVFAGSRLILNRPVEIDA